MSGYKFAEDLFIEFCDAVLSQRFVIQAQDYAPMVSFHSKLIVSANLTQNQANFVIKLLDKYKNTAALGGLDYRLDLSDVMWRTPFRVLDLSKRIYVELLNKKLQICVKFPYQLKKDFELDIDRSESGISIHSMWDSVDQVRRLDLYHFNLVALYEFAVRHNFEIDDTFMNVLADVEEIWSNSEEAVPHSVLGIFGVELKNANDSAKAWWQAHRAADPHRDLLLAKRMGYIFQQKPQNLIEKICHSPHNQFWIKNVVDFLQLTRLFPGKICVLLDRSVTTLPWLQCFVAAADQTGINRDEIKVCFRDSKDQPTGINSWIKAAGVGGSVETGRILIFESKPAKWLFKPGIDVTMLVTNNIFPPTSIMTRNWFECHPCVIYLGDTKPTENKGQKIVEL